MTDYTNTYVAEAPAGDALLEYICCGMRISVAESEMISVQAIANQYGVSADAIGTLNGITPQYSWGETFVGTGLNNFLLVPTAHSGISWTILGLHHATPSGNCNCTDTEVVDQVIAEENEVEVTSTNSSDVFNQQYAVRTTDDVLQQMWLRQCGGTIENYTRERGENCFRQYFAYAIYTTFDGLGYSSRDALMAIPNMNVVIDTATLDSWEFISSQYEDFYIREINSRQLGILLDQNSIEQRIAGLSLEEIVNLHAALLSLREQQFGESYRPIDEAHTSFGEAFQNALIWESGGIGDTSDFIPDLAIGDWKNSNPARNTFDKLFSDVVTLIMNAAHIGIFFDRFTYPAGLQNADFNTRWINFYSTEAENVLRQYIQQFPEFTEGDLVRLSIEISKEYFAKLEEWGNFSPESSYPEQDAYVAASNTATALTEYGQGYEDRIALDNLRAVIFDPAINPTVELEQLATLQTLISEMPTAILGTDVSFAKSGMETYHQMLVQMNEWHNQMRVHLTNVDNELIRRQDQGIPWRFLWWLGEFALAFLFEPLDWIITFRDIATGILNDNLSIWDFMGFLPIVTNRLADIAQLIARSDSYKGQSLSDIIQVDTTHVREEDFERFLSVIKEFETKVPQVHTTDGLPEIPISATLGNRPGGIARTHWSDSYTSRNDIPVRIDLNPTRTSMSTLSTLFHEFGHFLDIKGILSPERSSEIVKLLKHNEYAGISKLAWQNVANIPELQGWVRAIRGSASYNLLENATNLNLFQQGRRAIDSEFDRAYVQLVYHIAPEELFARSYQQYMLTRLGYGVEEMQEFFQSLVNMKHSLAHGNINLLVWDANDFAPILKAFDDMLSSGG